MNQPKFLTFQEMFTNQCRINNSSKSSNCYGTPAFGGPVVFCNKSCLLHYI